MISKRRARYYFAEITGNDSDVPLVDYRGEEHRATGLDSGVSVKLGTSTSADVTITDSRGIVLYSGTSITASINEVSAAGAHGPLLTTVANNSDGAHTLTVGISVWK